MNDFHAAFPDDMDGLPGLKLDAGDAGCAFVAAQGAQVLSWRASDGKERLYLSAKTGGMRRSDVDGPPSGANLFQAVRGGIPVCFPQFSGRGPLPKHGLARGLPWTAAQPQADAAAATFALRDSDATRAIWPHAFDAQLQVQLAADRLTVSLSVTNPSDTAWEFTCALHTYLRVDDIRQTRLCGLQNVSYEDAAANSVEVIQQEQYVTIGAEVDRVYHAPPDRLLLTENGLPSLHIEQAGFFDTVVWNPGPILANNLTDFPDDDWLRMLCVEAACASRPVRLEAGQTWRGSQSLIVAA